MIKLGQKVKDPITGCQGTAVGKTMWLYGCTRVGIQQKMDKDKKVPEIIWFDEPQLEGIDPKKNKTPGGPRPTPLRQRDPAH